MGFISNLSNDFIKLDPRIKIIKPLHSVAGTLLASVLPEVRICTRYGINPLTLATMNVNTGYSGEIKTGFMKPCFKISKKLGNNLPANFTSQSIEEYFAEKDDKGNYTHNNWGYMSIDEVAKQIKQSNNMSSAYTGMFEQFSRLWDGSLDETYLVSSGLRSPRDPYVCLSTATIPQFIVQLNDMFFQQGLCGRFDWSLCGFDFKKDKGLGISINKEQAVVLKRDKLIEKYKNILKAIRIQVEHYTNNGPKNIFILPDKEVDKPFLEFKHKVMEEYQYGRITEPLGYRWCYKIRLPEIVIKIAGQVTISRIIDNICSKGFTGDISMIRDDMVKAIKHVNESIDTLEYIMDLRDGLKIASVPFKNVGNKHHYMQLVYVLYDEPNYSCNSGLLAKKAKMSPAPFARELQNGIDKGFLKEVARDKIIDNEERIRLGLNTSAGKAIELTEETIKKLRK